MFGKLFSSMYDGSMIGAGANVFALMPWIISTQVGGQVEINPKKLAFVFGIPESDVISAIRFLCSADPKSRSKKEDGKRLLPMTSTGELPSDDDFQTLIYEVVNWEYYQKIRQEEDRREYMRNYMRDVRSSKSVNTRKQPLAKLANEDENAVIDGKEKTGRLSEEERLGGIRTLLERDGCSEVEILKACKVKALYPADVFHLMELAVSKKDPHIWLMKQLATPPKIISKDTVLTWGMDGIVFMGDAFPSEDVPSFALRINLESLSKK